MKIDPYNHENRYLTWEEKVKETGIPEISKTNSDLILRYLQDMRHGMNVSLKSKRGPRSFIRLNTIREKMIFFSKKFKEIYQLEDLTKITEDNLILFFSKIQTGELKKRNGKKFTSPVDYVKAFKSFWHWYITINGKQGKEIPDITIYLDTGQEKPKWVYLDEEQMRKLCSYAKYEYKVLIIFLFDTGIRSPTELVNVKVSDLSKDYKELHIKEEISKTFGRRIKLMLCSELIKSYIEDNNLGLNDYLFPIKPSNVNKYLQRLAERVFGEETSLAGQKYSELTMYDFRHISCCYWLPRYKSESALKYRFGWKKSDKIHYYSELLGMKDTIREEDLLPDIARTELERRLEKSERDNEMLKEEIKVITSQIGKLTESIETKFNQLKNNLLKESQ